MKRNLFSFAIIIICISIIKPLYGYENLQKEVFLESEYTVEHIDNSVLTDIDSLQILGGFQEFTFVENTSAKSIELEESALSLDNEMLLENWMMEVFEVEKMDQEIELEDWMLEPFTKD